MLRWIVMLLVPRKEYDPFALSRKTWLIEPLEILMTLALLGLTSRMLPVPPPLVVIDATTRTATVWPAGSPSMRRPMLRLSDAADRTVTDVARVTDAVAFESKVMAVNLLLLAVYSVQLDWVTRFAVAWFPAPLSDTG